VLKSSETTILHDVHVPLFEAPCLKSVFFVFCHSDCGRAFLSKFRYACECPLYTANNLCSFMFWFDLIVQVIVIVLGCFKPSKMESFRVSSALHLSMHCIRQSKDIPLLWVSWQWLAGIKKGKSQHKAVQAVPNRCFM
jgi:hypothetical protein